ncbi:MAG: hypothetical protein ACR2JC_05805 [Chloroflexota bacterium]
MLRPAAVVLALASIGPPLTAAGLSPRRQMADVKHLIAVANAGKLMAVDSLFSGNAIVQVESRQWKGRGHVMAWWRGEIRHHVHIALVSPLTTGAGALTARVRRHTVGGDCNRACSEQAIFTFTRSKIGRMTRLPLVRTGRPPALPTVPPPPSSPPSPRVTPTIPT